MKTHRGSNRLWTASLLVAGSCLLLLSGPQAARGAGALPAAAQASYPTGISLNEFMPDPVSDWNGDGVLGDANDEYIELYNANAFDVDISGWKLDDIAGGGSQPYTLPPGAVLRAQSTLVLFSVQTGIALNNSGGDSVRLLTPDDVEVESHSYTATTADQAYSKTFDGGTEWTRSYPPSPGASNQPPPPPSPTPIPTETPTPTITVTPSSTFTPTQGPTATPYPTGISLNEFMPNPEVDWNGDGILGDANDEYIELYNANGFAVDLGGWQVDDIANGGSSPYTLPAGTVLEAAGFLTLWSRDTRIGLNNSGGDAVRLLRPDGVEMESHSYTAAPADVSYSKTVDGGATWTMAYPPSPGASNQPAPTPTATATPTPTTTATPTPTSSPTPTATPGTRPTFTATPSPTATATPDLPPTPYPTSVFLNEFMPNPEADWNGDGITGDANDEYIELYNANDFAVDLSGWRVDDIANGGSSPYTLPTGTVIEAQGILALWSRNTGVALNNSGGDAVRLLTPDGVEVESHSYTAAPADVAYSKTVDGGDHWVMDYPPSPGSPNRPANTPTPTRTPTPAVYPAGVSLNEFMPDPASDWNGNGTSDLNDEYIELYNANDFAVDLSGWQLDDMDDSAHRPRWLFTPDGSPPYTLPAGTTIPAGGFLLFFRSQTQIALNNDSDWVRLLRPDGVVVEETQYTTSRDDEAYSKTADGGDEWTMAYPPSPGAANLPGATPTPTPTPSATPTGTPAVYPTGVSLNEFMPNPEADWNGDGILGNANDEYIELVNANDFAVDLSDWQVDDVAGGGSSPYTLPAGTVIEAQGFLALWSRDTRIALNNSGGDAVRLLRPDGVEVESQSYTAAPADVAYSKTADGGDQWTVSYPPSPGASNQPPLPTPTPTATPTATPGVYPDGVSLNEFMPDPASDWNGDGAADQNDEYIELYNANDFPVDLSGWRLDDMDDSMRIAPDGSPPYTLPPGTVIPARSFLLFFRSQSGLALNNDGDWVRLLRPDGVVVEAVEYSTSRDDQAVSKTLDGGDEWTRSYPPTPGGSNTPGGTPTPSPTATPQLTPTPVPTTVRLNEVLPSPQDVDWDGNGVPSYLDEWIELTNLGEEAVDLGGWKLADGPPAGHEPDRVYILPDGTTLPARGYLVIYRAQSGLALDASSEWVRLLYPDGSVADSMSYDRFSGYDQSWCRLPDGVGPWSRFCIETPGQPNQASPYPGSGSGSGASSSGSGTPYDRFNYDLLPIAQARSLPDRTRLTLEGQVMVLPNVFADKQIYIQDATGGMLVYLRSGEWPPLSEGQWVRVNGRLDTFYGEREISLVRIDDIKTLQPATPPLALPIRTGEMNEAHEGRLVQLSAPVTGYWKESTLYLDDGSGEARITIKASTGIRRPYVTIGEVWTVVGVVSQSESGYRLLPRREEDLQRGRAAASRSGTTAHANGAPRDMAWNRAPIYLPVTGAVLLVRPPAPANVREAWYQIRWLPRSP